MIECLIVGAGGFIGSVFRYLIGLIPVKESWNFPVKTFCINIGFILPTQVSLHPHCKFFRVNRFTYEVIGSVFKNFYFVVKFSGF